MDTKKYPHLLVKNIAQTEYYIPPKSFGKFANPKRDRQSHAMALIKQLETIQVEAKELAQKQTAADISEEHRGIYLCFESDPHYALKLDSLESKRQGIELCTVQKVDDKMLAVVFVPEGKLTYFMHRIQDYLHEVTAIEKPKNQSLIESIANMRRAMIDSLWTDDIDQLPDQDETIFWEVWLRTKNQAPKVVLDYFKEHALKTGLTVGHQQLDCFPDRVVILVHANKSQLSKSIDLFDCIAELRKAKDTADFFCHLNPLEQAEWLQEALERFTWSVDKTSPAVCILDTGINREHPLLSQALSESDMHTYHPSWQINDHDGHGTSMAGLALYGDLTDCLMSKERQDIKYQLESVKILPPPPHQNEKELYGVITQEAIARAEIAAPDRKRVVCMAVTATDSRDRGQPSTWSGALDATSAGWDSDSSRLMLVSAGNTNPDDRHYFPDSNQTDGVHDPGQAWNALTVGAYTTKSRIDEKECPGWKPVALPGELSPASCTSMIWQRPWPIKPEIVLEGGNFAIDPLDGKARSIDSLQLLTTYHKSTEKVFTTFDSTSAATALAAKMAATVYAEYPEFWPETVRALLVHHADWTEAMKAKFNFQLFASNREATQQLLRNCGFGVPNFNRVINSAQHAFTLIAQESLQPFDKIDNSYKTCQINLHELPWPREVLQSLGETEIEMRVTLSYFIEPNPGRRGWNRRYTYASHGLRFEVKTPEETIELFRQRINQAERDETSDQKFKGDAGDWLLGPALRNLGSLHTDRWKGTAAQLAERGCIAVYPVLGWWRERPQLGKWNKNARYSLVVSLSTPETSIDIYTPVAQLIESRVKITLSN